MSPDDPRHGTVAGREAHLVDGEEPCFPCRRAKAQYASHVYRQKAYGRWNPLVDAEPARAHVRSLIEAGMPYRKIATAAGFEPRRVSALLYGRGGQPPTRRIRPAFAEALLKVEPHTSRVPSIGAGRRLQALMALGHTPGTLATALGVTYSRIDQLVTCRQPVIMRETHDRVADLFDRLGMTPPTPRDRYEKQGIARARNRAKREGWAPPLAWDDDNIDDPKARPQGTGRGHEQRSRAEIDEVLVLRVLAGEWSRGHNCTVAERTEICRRWASLGGSMQELERLTGWKPERYYKVGEVAA